MYLCVVCPQDLARSRTEVEQLRRENTDLLEEVDAHKLMVRSSHADHMSHLKLHI